jgi:hypothetical protein
MLTHPDAGVHMREAARIVTALVKATDVMVQVGDGELRRTSSARSSQNNPSTH